MDKDSMITVNLGEIFSAPFVSRIITTGIVLIQEVDHLGQATMCTIKSFQELVLDIHLHSVRSITGTEAEHEPVKIAACQRKVHEIQSSQLKFDLLEETNCK